MNIQNPDFEDSEAFGRLLEWAARRDRNAYTTSLDVFERELGINRTRSVKLARALEERGHGRFVQGRRSRKSRVEWKNGIWDVVDRATRPGP